MKRSSGVYGSRCGALAIVPAAVIGGGLCFVACQQNNRAGPATAVSPGPPVQPAGQPSERPTVFAAPDVMGVPVSQVSISAHDAPLEEVLESIRSRTGVTVTEAAIPGQPPPRVTLEVRGQPFWEAFELLTEKVSLENSEWAVQWAPLKSGLPAFEHGPRVSVLAGRFSVREGCLVSLMRSEMTDGRVAVETMVAVDPSVGLAFVGQESTPSRAVDDHGHSLVWPGALSSRNVSGPRTTIALAAPAAAGRKIAEMIGSVRVGEMAIRHVEVNVGTTQEVRTPHMTVTVELIKVAAGNAAGAAGGNAAPAGEYRLTMGFVPAKAFDRAQWNDWRNMLMSFEVNLVDAEGHAFRRGRNGFAISAEGFSRRAYFEADPGSAAPGEAVKATMELPCDLEEVAVPYRFENITLP